MKRIFSRLLFAIGLIALIYVLFFAASSKKNICLFPDAESRKEYERVIADNNKALANFKEKLSGDIQPYFNVAATNGVRDFRKEIGSFRFIYNFLRHWKTKEQFLTGVINHEVGSCCESGLDEAEKAYVQYCSVIENNAQNYVKKLGENLEFDHSDDAATLETYRKDLSSLFEDTAQDTKINTYGSMLNAGTLPLMIDDVKAALGVTSVNKLDRGVAIYFVARELWNYFVERPKQLDKISDRLRCDVYDYYENVKNEYTTAAENKCRETNDLLKKIVHDVM